MVQNVFDMTVFSVRKQKNNKIRDRCIVWSGLCPGVKTPLCRVHSVFTPGTVQCLSVISWKPGSVVAAGYFAGDL